MLLDYVIARWIFGIHDSNTATRSSNASWMLV